MKVYLFTLVATAIVTTSAFPMPQEVKSISETNDQNEHVPMVQKIEIHVEVKAVPADMMVPAMVTVTEVKEHLEKSQDTAKSVNAKEIRKDVVKTSDVKSSESVESSEQVKNVKSVDSKPAADDIQADPVPEKTTETRSKLKEVETKNVEIDSNIPVATEKALPDAESTTQKIDRLVDVTLEPKPDMVQSPEPKNVVDKTTESEPVNVDSKETVKIEPKIDEDSNEDNSSEEKSTTAMVIQPTEKSFKASPVVTYDEAVKETTIQTIDEIATSVMPEVQNEDVKKADNAEKTVDTKPEAKSIMNEKIVPIVEDLPKEKQMVEAEPVYRTIPVAVVHDEPITKDIKDVTTKILESAEVAKKIGGETPVEMINKATTVTAIDSTVQARTEATTSVVDEKDDLSRVKTADVVQTVADGVTTEIAETSSEKVVVVDAVKAVIKEEKSSESIKNIEVSNERVEMGSSTKEVKLETETAPKQVEDSSVSNSADDKALEEATTPAELTEKPEEATTEERTTTTSTTTTTTTTAATPLKVEGKKGKKKLPANFRGYSKRLQQDQRKAH